jgi:hypothetical protein
VVEVRLQVLHQCLKVSNYDQGTVKTTQLQQIHGGMKVQMVAAAMEESN